MMLEATLSGHIEKVLYENRENGFVVLSFAPERTDAQIVSVGILQGAAPGQPLRLTGTWETNKNYGRQFRFNRAIPIRPTTEKAITRYLGSGLIPGIGKVMAKRIVKHFKERTLDILDGEINRLQEVPGIGKKSMAKVKAAWEKHRETRELALFCQEIGLSMNSAPKLAKAYGTNAEQVIRQDPFRLALDVRGIGFLTADQVASKLGVGKSHPGRAAAGLVHVLEEAGADGNVALPERVLLDRAARLLDLPPDFLKTALETTLDQGFVVKDKKVADEPMIYAKPAFLTEIRLASALTTLMKTAGNVRQIDRDKAIDWVEKRLDITLATAQRGAVLDAVKNKVMVITGGPGTGKTTIIKAIIEILTALDKSVALAAPTGRAAKRMAEATRYPATTVHRMLKFNPAKGGFEFDQKTPLRYSTVIVDEASMLDQWLAEKLVAAVPSTGKLVLVGDIDQLPSVGPGNVLGDIIASGQIPFVRLEEIFRQDSAGYIVKNAHLINAGNKPELPPKGDLADFYFMTEDDPARLKDLICDLVTNRLPEKFGFDPVGDIQVITPMHRGLAGVQSLNRELQAKLNPDGNELVRGENLFREGDKVMQTVNDYNLEVFNGDIGRVAQIRDGEMTVRFDDGTKQYSKELLDNLVPAYALSVHKSQGSEYPAVVVPLSTQHYIMLQRNLLYTAVTRAKKLVVLAGSWNALFQALKNDRPAHRYTGLSERLKTEETNLLL